MAAKTTLRGQSERLDRMQGANDWADIVRVEASWPKKPRITWKSAYTEACRRFPQGVSFYWLDKRVAYLEGVLSAINIWAIRDDG